MSDPYGYDGSSVNPDGFKVLKVLIGGNHLASMLINSGCDPGQFQSFNEVQEKFGIGIADVWICWKAIMEFRPNPAPSVERQPQKIFDDIRHHVQIQKADEPKLLEILAAHNSVSVSAEAKPPKCHECGSAVTLQLACTNMNCCSAYDVVPERVRAAFFPPERGSDHIPDATNVISKDGKAELPTAEQVVKMCAATVCRYCADGSTPTSHENGYRWLHNNGCSGPRICKAGEMWAALACVQEGRR